MERQHIASMVIASASLSAVGIMLAAEDRFTLKTPVNGLKAKAKHQVIKPLETGG